MKLQPAPGCAAETAQRMLALAMVTAGLEAERTSAGRLRRVAEVGAFVALSIALGEALDMNPNVYLVVNIPLVVAFQLLVARRPVRALWLRDAPRFALGRREMILAALLAIVPLVILVDDLAAGNGLPVVLWDLATIAGAIPAAWALGHFTRLTSRQLLLCLATAGPIGLFWTVGLDLLGDVYVRHVAEPDFDVIVFLEYALLYLPAAFVMEEVVFRGALDSRVQQPGERHGILTAVYVSVLWGLWHIPVAGTEGTVMLVVVMGTTGVPLSLWWRRSRNLAVSGGTHSFVDAARNGIGNFPP